MRELLHSVALRAARYLEEVKERRVGPSAEAVRDFKPFLEPLAGGPTAPEEVIRILDELGSPATMAVAGPRFFGFVFGGSLPAATPVATVLEEVSLPAGCGGGFVTGATVASFTALAA